MDHRYTEENPGKVYVCMCLIILFQTALDTDPQGNPTNHTASYPINPRSTSCVD